MTPVRAGVALMICGLVCLLVVALRVERMRVESRTQAHFAQRIDARRRTWRIEMEIARLRSPLAIRNRVRRMELRVYPGFDEILDPADAEVRFAANER